MSFSYITVLTASKMGEDARIAMSQLTCFDHFASAVSQADFNHYIAVVAVPPNAPDARDKWVAVSPAEGIIDTSIRQPDPERNALCGYILGGSVCGCLCYWYDNELPSCIALTVVMAVILSILTTPLVLLCFVPMIHKMNKVSISVTSTIFWSPHLHSFCVCDT